MIGIVVHETKLILFEKSKSPSDRSKTGLSDSLVDPRVLWFPTILLLPGFFKSHIRHVTSALSTENLTEVVRQKKSCAGEMSHKGMVEKRSNHPFSVSQFSSIV
jgi:hypothetical protein